MKACNDMRAGELRLLGRRMEVGVTTVSAKSSLPKWRFATQRRGSTPQNSQHFFELDADLTHDLLRLR